MSILDNILARTTATKAAAPQYPSWLRAGATNETWRIPEMSTAERQAQLYAKLSWLQSAVALVAETAAAATFQVKERRSDGLKDIPNHPFELLLEDPNPNDTQFELLVATFSWLKVTGNCYWWLNRVDENAEPSEIFIIPAHQIQPVPDGRMFLRGYVYDAGDGNAMPLDVHEVCHFKRWNPKSKYVGLSVVEALAIDAAGDIAAQRFNADFYGKDNAKADGILAFKDYIEEGRWNRLRADWSEQHGGTKNKRIMMLRGAGDGVNWIQTQLTRGDMQYLEQRTFTKEQIYDLVAPGLSSVLAVNATEANSTAGKDTLLSMAIFPLHMSVSHRITKSVLPPYGKRLKGEFEDVRRTDTLVELKQREAFERTHTIDETRAKYDGDGPLPPGARTVTQGPAPAPQPTTPQPDMLAQAGKALDRQRWQSKAFKSVAGGRGAEVAFDPDYLSEDEAMEIRAALRRARSADDIRAAFKGE